MLRVRERNTFYLRRIHLNTPTIAELRSKILEKYKGGNKGELWSIYKLWDRTKQPLNSDKSVELLHYGDELELVFENPGWNKRTGYYQWSLAKQQNQKYTGLG